MIIAVSGLVEAASGQRGSAGAGKSTVAARLVEKHGYTEVGLADIMKRFCMEVFGFTEAQMFGPSEKRNEPDKRYPREPTRDELIDGEREEFLTPRLALQKLGTEWGRNCYPDVWVVHALRIAKALLEGGYVYSPKKGLEAEYGHPSSPQYPYNGVVIPDMRFRPELDYIKRNGGKTLRVIRPVKSLFVDNGHQSENDLNDIPDSEFDFVIHGLEKDVPDLERKVDALMATPTLLRMITAWRLEGDDNA